MITSRKAWSMYTSTVTRFYISLCISCLTSSTDWPQKHSAKGTTIHPFGPFIIPLQVSTHGWAHWWFNMSAPPCLPPSPLSVFLPPLRWNLKAKSGGCWEMNFRKRFHSFHNTVSPSPLTVSFTVFTCSSSFPSDLKIQRQYPLCCCSVHLLWNDAVLKAQIKKIY